MKQLKTGILRTKFRSNIVPQRAQFRRKLKIVGNGRGASQLWRVGRHSSPDPSCRPARFLAGVFGDFRDEGEGCPRRKNQGAVADESDSHRLLFSKSQTQITFIPVARSGPLPLPHSLWRASRAHPHGRSASVELCLCGAELHRRREMPCRCGARRELIS